MAGSSVVGVMVCTPAPMRNSITSVFGRLLAELIASRSVPEPLLPGSFTVIVAAWADVAAPSANMPAPSATVSFLLSMSPLPKGRGVVAGKDLWPLGKVGRLTRAGALALGLARRQAAASPLAKRR